MPTRNVTLSLPDDLVRRAKVLAAERDTSMSALVGDLLTQTFESGDSYDAMWHDEETFMARGKLRVGKRLPSRDELHER